MHFQLLILESIGTQELILVGLVALIVFGPRKLPQMARKAGKMMTELRKVSNDFRSTWEREASMVEEAFKVDDNDRREPRTISPPAGELATLPKKTDSVAEDTDMPSVKELSAEDYEKFSGSAKKEDGDGDERSSAAESDTPASGKMDWL